MIRQATSEDLPALRAIQGSALDEPWPALLRVAIDGPPTVAVIDDGGSPIGYALVIEDDDAAYVAELAVAPPAQDEGFGSTLLEGLLDRLERAEVGRVRLTTHEDDRGLRAFYGKFGFDAIDRLPDHYEDGDGVLLEREFGE